MHSSHSKLHSHWCFALDFTQYYTVVLHRSSTRSIPSDSLWRTDRTFDVQEIFKEIVQTFLFLDWSVSIPAEREKQNGRTHMRTYVATWLCVRYEKSDLSQKEQLLPYILQFRNFINRTYFSNWPLEFPLVGRMCVVPPIPPFGKRRYIFDLMRKKYDTAGVLFKTENESTSLDFRKWISVINGKCFFRNFVKVTLKYTYMARKFTSTFYGHYLLNAEMAIR